MKDFRIAVRFVFPYWKKYWKYELVLILMLGMRFAAQLFIPITFKYVVDTIVTSQLRQFFTQALVIFCALIFLTIILSWFFKVLVTWVGEGLNIDITSKVYDRVLRQHRSFWEKFYPNDVLTRLTQDIFSVKSFAIDVSHDLLFQFATLLGTVVILFIMSKDVGVVILAYIPAVFIATYIGNDLLRKSAIRLNTLRSSFTQVFSEGIQQPSITFSWALSRFHFKKYHDLAFQMKKEQVFFANKMQFINVVISTLNLFIGSATVIWLLRSSYEEGLLTTGALMALVMYAGQATQSTVALAVAITSGKLGRMSVLRINELLSYEQDHKRIIDPFAEKVVHPHFKGGLKNGILIPSCGPFPYFLHGENGSGKTTFANILTGFDDLSGKVVNQQWFLVPSGQRLFAGPLIENIRVIAGREASEADVVNSLRENQMESLLSIFPQGFSTIIAENSEKISQGQKQAAVLIGAIVKDPENVIVDEGLNSLERDVKEHIREGFISWLKGRRSIVIEHDGFLSAMEPVNKNETTMTGLRNG